MRRYERPHINEVWCADTCVDPYLKTDDGKKHKNLKMLFNFEMDSRDRAVILLVGLPQLNSTLSMSAHEPLRQRLVMNYNLDGISKEEAREYISSKLSGAGGDISIFDDNAIEAIINGSDGTPRLINKLCNQSMMIAALSGLKTVSSESVMNAINECELA